jgi:benzoyl-CoA reductase/2-hydroxyglutaryl-CoA dehydratase subunit BcrC/BadD/HgdB
MVPKLEKSSQNLKHLMTKYFMENHRDAHEGKFVVWIAIVVPTELLHGFDLVISVPENHAAVCAAKGVGAEQAQKAESRGYSIDLCSYARIDLGTFYDNGGGSPTMGLPKPNLLISNNNNCSHLVKWFDVYHREYGIPHFVS